ncbi:MAG: TauD/TfdA family dioxygenase [Magnetococcales bacterium]|nr:TauD/TfdA family dioxygenase [Magnetococcales bacterium]
METMPFDLNDDTAYLSWKRTRLSRYPTTLAELVVEIRDPFAMTPAEVNAILSRCARANMALFRLERPVTGADNPLPAMTARLGVHLLDRNLGAGEEGISALTPGGSAFAPFASYIPYRQAAIGWHTDGYYNPADQPVQTLCLYCARPAHEGGENELLDHELVYLRLRDANPEFIHTLMASDCMTIPPRLEEDGTIARPERSGPVFSVTPAGHLHMRFTNRTRSIRWRDDEATRQALAALREVLATPAPWIFRGRLESGWGLISNNVLHTRTAFRDPPGTPPRSLYRARLFDRLPEPA